MELHLSLTLIPVIQKSTITSYGVIGLDVIIKRQVFCLSVAADQDSKTKDYPMSDIVFVLFLFFFYIYLYTTAPDSKQKQFWFLLNTCEWTDWPDTMKQTDFTELSNKRRKKRKKKKKQHSSGTQNWLKHVKVTQQNKK